MILFWWWDDEFNDDHDSDEYGKWGTVTRVTKVKRVNWVRTKTNTKSEKKSERWKITRPWS